MGGKRLGIGIIGSGFNARFHLQAFVAVRDADVFGVWSPNQERARAAAALARDLDVGPAKPYRSITEMVADPAIEALWLCGPNHARLENVEEIVHAITSGRGKLTGLACEKPLARNVAEATRIAALVQQAGLQHGYLENQLFAPQVVRGHDLIWARGAAVAGRPYLARAAEEHSGPHAPWFWQGRLQGGGVLNDMMCHSVEVVRYLLTEPDAPRASLRLARVTARIASLKWTRPEYASSLSEAMGPEVDYTTRPAEDFASVTLEFESDGRTVLGEATTSWSFVGPGLRLSAELLGPEYSMSWNTLDSGLKLFFSREVGGRSRRGSGGEAERRGRAHAGGGERGRGLWLRGGEPALRSSLPAGSDADAHLRRRTRGGAHPHGRLHERGTGAYAAFPARRAGQLRPCGGHGQLETLSV